MPHDKHQCCRSRILFNVTCVRLARGSGGSPRNGGTGTPIPAAHAMPPSARPHRFCTRFVIMVCPNLRLKGASYVGPLFYIKRFVYIYIFFNRKVVFFLPQDRFTGWHESLSQ